PSPTQPQTYLGPGIPLPAQITFCEGSYNDLRPVAFPLGLTLFMTLKGLRPPIRKTCSSKRLPWQDGDSLMHRSVGFGMQRGKFTANRRASARFRKGRTTMLSTQTYASNWCGAIQRRCYTAVQSLPR